MPADTLHISSNPAPEHPASANCDVPVSGYIGGDSAYVSLMQPHAADYLIITREEVAEPEPEWMTGMEGDERVIGVGDNSGVLAVVATVFVLMMLSYRNCKRLLARLYRGLIGMRNRNSIFHVHTTNETRLLVLMAVQWCLCTGLLLYSAISQQLPLSAANAFPDTGQLILLMAGYYVFQYCAYSVVGYTFADNSGRKQYVRGFTASQSLLGFALIIPALVSIFYPTAATAGVFFGALFYIIARMVFIVKGFRIFYTNYGSLFYFILYLCALEIIPLLLIFQIAITLVNPIA